MLNNKDYRCYVISNRREYFPSIQQSINPENIEFFDGTGVESFSKLINSCVAACPTETVILMSDKVRPAKEHVDKVLNLLNEGYGFVALYRFAFFGFKKELFRKIGVMDQHFIGGGGEDDDFYIRLNEANIGCYINEEVPYMHSPTSWGGYSYGKQQLLKKWGPWKKMLYIKRHYTESQWGYNLGPSLGNNFLLYDQSIIQAKYVNRWAKKIILGINEAIPTAYEKRI